MPHRNYRIIDAHAHIFPEKIRAQAVKSIGDFYTLKMRADGSAAHLVEMGSSMGVTNYVVHSVATAPRQVVRINDFIHRKCKAYPQFIGFATLHPDMDGLEEELERVISLGFKGIKLHPDFQTFDIDEEKAKRIYDLLDNRLPILMHMGDKTLTHSTPERLARVLPEFPKQVFIAAHFGGYAMWKEAAEHVIGKNVYVDTSSSLAFLSPEEAAGLIRAHGADKVMFGTDYPMWLHGRELELFLGLPLTEEERRMILGGNAVKLFGLEDSGVS